MANAQLVYAPSISSPCATLLGPRDDGALESAFQQAAVNGELPEGRLVEALRCECVRTWMCLCVGLQCSSVILAMQPALQATEQSTFVGRGCLQPVFVRL